MSSLSPQLGTGEWFDFLATDYKRLVAISTSIDAAVIELERDHLQSLTRGWRSDRMRKGVEATFWLSLAVYQWKLGHLQPKIKSRALSIINSEYGMRNCDMHGSDARRAKAYADVATILNSPMPPARTIKKAKVQPSPLGIGTVLIVSNPHGVSVACLVVSSLQRDGLTMVPYGDLYPWSNATPPTLSEIKSLRRAPRASQRPLSIAIRELGKRPAPSPGIQMHTVVGVTERKPHSHSLTKWFDWDTLRDQLISTACIPAKAARKK